MDRRSVLETALQILYGDRNDVNGDPGPNFTDIALLWSVYFGRTVEPWDVAACLIMLKLCRIKRTPEREDHWVDVAGYAACGAESWQYDKTEKACAALEALLAEDEEDEECSCLAGRN